MNIFLFLFVVLSFAPLSEAAKGKKCVPVEPEEMLRSYNDEASRLKNMYIFDIRPYSVAMNMKGKQVLQSRLITAEGLDSKAVYAIDWKGKKIYLVGEDTESTETFCRRMIKKDFVRGDIYVLKGGVNAWTGPVMPKFENTVCEVLNYSELMDMLDSGRKVEIMDLRSSEDYNRNHIPDAVRGHAINKNRLYLNERSSNWAELRDKNGIVVFIGNTEYEARHRCRSAKRGSGLDILYVLKGNLKGWEGNLEREHIELLKSKLKSFFGGKNQ